MPPRHGVQGGGESVTGPDPVEFRIGAAHEEEEVAHVCHEPDVALVK